MKMISCQARRFLLPEGAHYLNCAYFSPTSRDIENAAVGALETMRWPGGITPDMFFRTADEVRRAFSAIINAPDPRSVAILPSVSYGIAVIARNTDVHPGQRIVVLEEQFPSNVYSWKRLALETGATITTVPAPRPGPRRGRDWNDRLLEAITGDTAVVAIPHSHWTDGTRFEIDAVGARSRDVGALFVLDGSQSVGVAPIDVATCRPDALICAGYKWLFGPYSMCLGYYGPRLMEGTPLEENWMNRRGSQDFAALVHYRDEYEPGAVRYDVGEKSNFLLLPMMLKGLQHVLEWQPRRIQAYCAKLMEPALAEIEEYGYSVEPEEGRFAHLVGIRTPDGLPTEKLAPALRAADVFVSVRGSAVRVAPHVYNDKRDVEALVDVLAAAAREA